MSTSEDTEGIARRYLEEVGEGASPGRVDEFVAEDVVNHDPVSAVDADPGSERGVEAFRRHVEAVVHGLSDRTFDIQNVIAEDDLVMVHLVRSGTHTGRFLGIEPTGRPVRFSSTVVYRIDDGKIVERWSEGNTLGVMQQLGAVPAIPWQPAPQPVQQSQGQQFQQPRGGPPMQQPPRRQQVRQQPRQMAPRGGPQAGQQPSGPPGQQPTRSGQQPTRSGQRPPTQPGGPRQFQQQPMPPSERPPWGQSPQQPPQQRLSQQPESQQRRR